MHRTIEITVPPSRTDGLVEELGELGGVVSLSVVRGASVKPEGDVVTVHALNRGADEVLRLAEAANEHGPVSVSTGELTSLADPEHAQEVARDVDEALWEEVETDLRRQSRATANFLVLMALGGAVAATGFVTKSTPQAISFVAAAIVAPGFEPLAKVGAGLALRRWGSSPSTPRWSWRRGCSWWGSSRPSSTAASRWCSRRPPPPAVRGGRGRRTRLKRQQGRRTIAASERRGPPARAPTTIRGRLSRVVASASFLKNLGKGRERSAVSGVDPTRWILLAVLASAAALIPACGRSADCPGGRTGVGTAEGGGGTGSGALTVMSANIYLGGKKDLPGLDRMACYLGDADVVFLQEADEEAARTLAKKSGLTNLRFARAQDPREGGYGVAILSRYPLGPAEERELPETQAPYDVVLKTAVRLRGRPVALIDAFYAAGYDEDGKRARLRASEVVLDLLDGTEGPAILGGDLNATAGRPGIPPLAARMTDSFAAAPRGRCHCEEPYGRIDYVFFRGPFAVRWYEAPCWSRWPWWPSREADPPGHEEAGCSPGRAALSDHPFVGVRLDMTTGG